MAAGCGGAGAAACSARRGLQRCQRPAAQPPASLLASSAVDGNRAGAWRQRFDRSLRHSSAARGGSTGAWPATGACAFAVTFSALSTRFGDMLPIVLAGSSRDARPTRSCRERDRCAAASRKTRPANTRSPPTPSTVNAFIATGRVRSRPTKQRADDHQHRTQRNEHPLRHAVALDGRTSERKTALELDIDVGTAHFDIEARRSKTDAGRIDVHVGKLHVDFVARSASRSAEDAQACRRRPPTPSAVNTAMASVVSSDTAGRRASTSTSQPADGRSVAPSGDMASLTPD